MMIHNLVKYLVQTRLHLWDIKIINFRPESCPNDLLEIFYFCISQTKSSLDKIFYKVVYHHIIYMCDLFGKFRWLFLPWFPWVFTKVVDSTRYVPIYLAVTLTLSPTDQNEILHDPRHLVVPWGAPKMIYEPTGHSAQTMHLSWIKISTISKWIETSFRFSLVT
jgi:hypothetical protein